MASLVGAITTLGLLGVSVAAPVYDPDYDAPPTYPRPYTDTWTGLGLNSLPGKRAVDFSGKVEITLAAVSATDTIYLQVTEDPVDEQEIATQDNARLAVSDTAALFNNIANTDTASITLSETVSLLVSGVVTKTASDTASIAIAEAASINVTVDATDTASITLSDEDSDVVVSVEQKSASDTASISIDEEHLLNIFTGVNVVNASDTCSLTLGESVTATEVRRIRRVALDIHVPRIELEIV